MSSGERAIGGRNVEMLAALVHFTKKPQPRSDQYSQWIAWDGSGPR